MIKNLDENNITDFLQKHNIGDVFTRYVNLLVIRDGFDLILVKNRYKISESQLIDLNYLFLDEMEVQSLQMIYSKHDYDSEYVFDFFAKNRYICITIR